jgi:diamine N-acetyltransferase
MRGSVSFRYGTDADASALAELAARAFSVTYRDLDDPKDIADYVAEHFNVHAVSAVLRNRACTTFLAESEAKLAGYAVLQSVDPPPCVTGSLPIELARFYLGEEFIGKGFGAQLMRAVHTQARRLNAQTIWLGVYDRNVRAVRFYERFGFGKVGGKEFLFGGKVYVDPIYSAPVQDDA